MLKTCFWLSLFAFIALVVVDTLCTSYYIGDDWEQEVNPIMSWMIKEYGIGTAIWYARACFGVFFFFIFLLKDYRTIQIMFMSFVLFYLIAMTEWLFILGYLEMPNIN